MLIEVIAAAIISLAAQRNYFHSPTWYENCTIFWLPTEQHTAKSSTIIRRWWNFFMLCALQWKLFPHWFNSLLSKKDEFQNRFILPEIPCVVFQFRAVEWNERWQLNEEKEIAPHSHKNTSLQPVTSACSSRLKMTQ